MGDSILLVYAGKLGFAPDENGGWFNSSVGFGTLGYALPAAIGAKLAAPQNHILALVGDGGLQFSLGELGSLHDIAATNGMSLTVLVWNNQGYGEIRDYMVETGVKPEGVDLLAPDFASIAKAYGIHAITLEGPSNLISSIQQAHQAGQAILIDLHI